MISWSFLLKIKAYSGMNTHFFIGANLKFSESRRYDCRASACSASKLEAIPAIPYLSIMRFCPSCGRGVTSKASKVS